MKTQSNKEKKISATTVELEESKIWNDTKMKSLREFILTESKKQSPERKLRNDLLAIKYQMEDYIENENIENEMLILDFVKLYLKSLNITQRKLANVFEMKDTNLYKYLKGERKLNTDIVFKLSSFSHTPPELWYYIQTKNELYALRKKKTQFVRYKKYDYKNFISISDKVRV